MSTEVQTATGRFTWHENYSGDVEAAREFYGGLFGWDWEIWKPGDMDYAMVKVGERTHGGFLAARDDAPAHWLGIVTVESAEETAKRVTEAGGSVHAGPMEIPEVGHMVVLGDPQGGALAAMSPLEGAPEMPGPPEGVFVWDELQTPDVEDAKRFYGEVFGWDSSDMDMGEAGTYTIFRKAGDAESQIAGTMTPPQEMPGAFWLVYLYADDVDEIASKAAEGGGQALMEPTDVEGVGRLAILQDPQGAVFGIFKPSES